jgi:cytidylate kinase
VANLQRLEKLSEKEAARLEEKTSRERHDFVKRHFGKDVGDPHLYDLVLNTSRLSADDCAELIVAALQRLQARKPVVMPELART